MNTPRQETAARLRLALGSLEAAESYLNGISEAAFRRDQEKQDSVRCRIQDFGEEMRKIRRDDRSFITDYPAIDVNRLADIRNDMVHEYLDYSWAEIWDAAHDALSKAPLIHSAITDIEQPATRE